MSQIPSSASTPFASPHPLPARPNLEYLKNEAKRRLAAQRIVDPDLKLTAMQFDMAREYGFASWRALKTALAQPSPLIMEAAGDWIAQLAHGTRIALHVRADGATMDSPDYGSFGFAVHGFEAGGERMAFNLPRINARFLGAWSAEEQLWRGAWRQDGLEYAVEFRRGVFPPAPVVEGLHGIWEGLFDDQLARLVLCVVTNKHGTFATCDSPDRGGYSYPVQTIERREDRIAFRMKTALVEGTLDASGHALDAIFTRDGKVFSITLHRRLLGDAPLELPVADLPPDILPNYAGAYGPESWRVVVTLGKDGLSARFPNGDVVDMVAINEREFRFRRGVGRLIFDIEADGSVSGLIFRLRGHDSPARRHS